CSGAGTKHQNFEQKYIYSSYAAGKRTTFFLPLPTMIFEGKKVSSTYLVARSTSSRLPFKPSLCLMFSRWLSTVFTLRLSECAIWLLRSPEPNKLKTCISRSDSFSMPVLLGECDQRCSGRDSNDFLNARIATSRLT